MPVSRNPLRAFYPIRGLYIWVIVYFLLLVLGDFKYLSDLLKDECDYFNEFEVFLLVAENGCDFRDDEETSTDG